MKQILWYVFFLAVLGPAKADLNDDVAYCKSQILPHLRQPSSAQDFYCLGIQSAGLTGDHQPNDVESARFYRRAADMGHPGAQNALGSLYAAGKGVSKSYGEALKWYRRAADQGNSDSMYAIGGLYQFGRGVPKDQQEANRWFERANAGPKTISQPGHSVYDEGEGQYRASKEQAIAVSYNAPAPSETEFQLGRKYEYGEGVPKNLETAARWYARAAAEGDARAQARLGSMYEQAEGVSEDWTKAAQWWTRSAGQGNAEGMYQLGRAYAFGIGVLQNRSMAEKWFEEAAGKGDAAKHTMDPFRIPEEKSIVGPDSAFRVEPRLLFRSSAERYEWLKGVASISQQEQNESRREQRLNTYRQCFEHRNNAGESCVP